MIELRGKRILIFSPYGTTVHYGNAIIEELRKRGAEVIGYDERPSQGTFSKIIIRLLKNKIPQLFNNYLEKVILDNNDATFDYILICRGEAFNKQSIELLREAYPKAKIILYLWDILQCADLRHIIQYCDKAMSFDPQDVEENEGLEFRPTFYMNVYTQMPDIINKKHDCIFIGTVHSNRHKIINNIKNAFMNQGIELYSYLYIPSIIVYLKDLVLKFPYISLRKVHFRPMGLKETLQLMEESACILDINYSSQKSLSFRVYEAMASRRKYITTNPEVKSYDFYNPNNIAVIDISNPLLPEGFIDSPFEPISQDIMKKYSVQGLVDDLFP